MASEKKYSYYEPPDPTKPKQSKKTEPIVDIYADDDEDEHSSELSAIFKWKLRNSPLFSLVPIGLLGVVGSFIYGMRGVAKGDNKANLRGQTGRVVFQSIVILGIIGDFYWESRMLRQAKEKRRREIEKEQNQ